MSEGEKVGFYDMFCGIGAFHLAAPAEWVCTGAADNDKYAKIVYEDRFGITPVGDIRSELDRLPEGTDILFAGFPCPTFSIAGKSKLTSLGRKHGLEEYERGRLIFRVRDIVEATEPKPKVIVLENVKHLLTHDEGQTLATIMELFRELGYEGRPWLLNASDFGVPQNRERVFIALFLGGEPDGFQVPASAGSRRKTLAEIVEDSVPDKYTLGPGTWETLQRHKRKHQAKGNGFGYRMLDIDDPEAVSPTISARYHKDGAEALVDQGKGRRPRRLTPREVARLMGFPEQFDFPVSDTQAYRQLGNSIVVPVARAVVGAVAAQMTDVHTDRKSK